jgi:riboflavin biosynthesis pyrimidine reductase
VECSVPNAFDAFAASKTREAAAARIARLATISDRRTELGLQGIGNSWSRLHYDGDFALVRPVAQTAVSLVFVQTKSGDTGGPDPASFGAGATDTHLIYEGLSRVAAHAVLVGTGTLHADAFFSVWHPELVALRTSLGLPRHPAQIVVSKRGAFSIDARLFNVPDVPVFLIGGEACASRHAAALRARPWIRLILAGDEDLRPAIDRLRVDHGIERISAIGGRFTATRLVDSGLVQDICLTTTSREGGEPGTPWYSGAHAPRLTPIARKEWREDASPVTFEHALITGTV